MPQTFHFIAGLPRSGSTLLSALLRQNPRCHASVTSPLYAMVDRMVDAMGAERKYSSFFDDGKRARVLRGLFENYYEDSPADLIFDTNRMWTANAPMLAQLFPQARIICCVRDVFRIIDSFERILRANPLQYNSLFNYKNEPSIYGRVQIMMNARDGVIGGPHSALRSLWFTEFAKRLIVVRYESLTKAPEATLARLYDLIGEPRFAHDPATVEADETEYDLRIGLPGLHRVRKGVTPAEKPLSIPPDIYHNYATSNFWDGREENIHGVPVI
ncbi:sulfotransferase family protein [Sphingomonas oryzagri]|uniref:Sulfotransferase n=1 Tax=Sphingomonas oryzagri TaxID=3042314 RepID=A0ABT6MXN5_9SPHN|nr:sulfotransferase [Sphingomonas oryzagri]MDH7637775.1 sulfotransferase [Sphingomonas oryzagri]